LARTKRRWYERELIKRINRNWVEANCRLTQRELELLKIIYDRKIIRRDLLEIIAPPYRNLGENRTQILNRSIRKLFEQMCIDKVHEKQVFQKGNTPAFVAIDKAGAILLDRPFKQRIKTAIKNINGKEYVFRKLPSNYKHLHHIHLLEAETITFCEQNDCELICWRIEDGNTKNFTFNNEAITLIPDVFAILKFQNKTLALFLEYDSGTENERHLQPKTIQDKIIKYKKYYLSMLWQNEDWQIHFPRKIFPVLLFVAHDLKRIKFFNKIAEQQNIAGLGVIFKNYKNFLAKLSST